MKRRPKSKCTNAQTNLPVILDLVGPAPPLMHPDLAFGEETAVLWPPPNKAAVEPPPTRPAPPPPPPPKPFKSIRKTQRAPPLQAESTIDEWNRQVNDEFNTIYRNLDERQEVEDKSKSAGILSRAVLPSQPSMTITGNQIPPPPQPPQQSKATTTHTSHHIVSSTSTSRRSQQTQEKITREFRRVPPPPPSSVPDEGSIYNNLAILGSGASSPPRVHFALPKNEAPRALAYERESYHRSPSVEPDDLDLFIRQIEQQSNHIDDMYRAGSAIATPSPRDLDEGKERKRD